MKKINEFLLERVHVSTSKNLLQPCCTEAIVKIRVDGSSELAVGGGNGPVCALDNALFKALKKFWPELERVRLQEYQVRVVNSQDGTAAKVEVEIAVGNGSIPWRGTESSTNVLEASWLVLARSYRHQLEGLQQG
jgi:2-isopropylmalate synthase